MAANVFAETIGNTGRTREDWPVLEIAFDLSGKFRRRAVATVAVSLESFHGNPIEIAAEKRDELSRLETAKIGALDGLVAIGVDFGARTGRVLFAKNAEEFIEWLLFKLLSVEGKRTGEQFIENDAK
jgi:hypothetical protein